MIIQLEFPEKAPFKEVCQKLCDTFELEEIEVATPPRHKEIEALEIAEYPSNEWISSNDSFYNDVSINGSPFNWLIGDIIVVKNANISFKVLTENEQKLIRKKLKNDEDSYDNKYLKPKEVGISIKSKSFLAPN